jgi:hypothetical protein
MTLNKIDNPTIKISLEFIKEFEKDKTYRTITYDDIKNEKVKEKNLKFTLLDKDANKQSKSRKTKRQH